VSDFFLTTLSLRSRTPPFFARLLSYVRSSFQIVERVTTDIALVAITLPRQNIQGMS
jgi:hypothetical protein